jgi:DNA-binding winged helix-turn-helix (wHTH) protein
VRVYRFGNFTLNCETRQLLRESESLHVSPKAFRLLELLINAAPRALSKAELQDGLWPDTFVVEANLQHLIGELRTALADDPRRPRYLRTVHGFGYAFQATAASPASRPSTVLCRLRWESGRVTLSEGEHTIGRDATADVVLDSVHVSRRHARIRLYDGEVTIEDLGSKNGTFVRDQRVDGTVKLGDRDHLRFGGLEVGVRISGESASTETVLIDLQRRASAR